MDQTLVKQIQAVIDALQLAGADAKTMKATMRRQRLSFGLEFNHVDADITQIIAKLRYMQQPRSLDSSSACAFRLRRRRD